MMIRASHSIPHNNNNKQMMIMLLTENLTRFQESKHRSRTCLVSWVGVQVSSLCKKFWALEHLPSDSLDKETRYNCRNILIRRRVKRTGKYFIWFIVQNYLIKLLYKSTIEFTFSSIRSYKVLAIQYILLQKIVDIEIYLQNRGASASKSFWVLKD